jgi:transposase
MDAEKKTFQATERDSERVQRLRAEFEQALKGIAIEALVFLDESGVTIQMARPYGRSASGRRVKGRVPGGWGRVLTVLGTVRADGMGGAMTICSPTDRAVFLAFLTEVVVPALRPGQVVVMDNLSAHKGPVVQALIEGAQCRLLYLPPYHPEFNPIESCWAKVKALLRGMEARTRATLEDAVAWALECVTPEDTRGAFTSALTHAQRL